MLYAAFYSVQIRGLPPIKRLEANVRAPNDALARKYATKTGRWLKADLGATSCRRVELTQGRRVVG